MATFWNRQIERADYLASESSGSKELLTFYSQLLRAQSEIYESFRSRKKLVGFRRPGKRSAASPVVDGGVIANCCAARAVFTRLRGAGASRCRAGGHRPNIVELLAQSFGHAVLCQDDPATLRALAGQNESRPSRKRAYRAYLYTLFAEM